MAPDPTRHPRRRFLQGGLGLAGLALLSGCAQPPSQAQPPKVRRIGVLSGHPLDPSPEGAAFRGALRDLGYVEGQNLSLAFRYAGLPETSASAAAELIGAGCDVVVTVDDEATRAAMEASGTVPIVMADSRDPVGTGLIAGLARPGGKVTGLTSLTAALTPKRLELLRAAVPGVTRVAFLWHTRTGDQPDLRDLVGVAERMGVQLVPVLSQALNMGQPLVALAVPVDGVIVSTLGSARADAARVAGSVNASRLPTIYDAGSFAQASGLMAYGANTAEQFRRAATYVDKILKGAEPGELPVEQPTRFDLVINLRTAQALGLTIPPSVLQQATELIQ